MGYSPEVPSVGNLRLSNEGELHPIYRESLKPGGRAIWFLVGLE